MEYKDVVNVLSNNQIKEFVISSLIESMTNLGFSKELMDEFLGNIDKLDLDKFISKYSKELGKIELGHFFGELVPAYFNKNVVVEVPDYGKVLDLGCGRGTLIQELIKRGKNIEIVGIDIKETPEWSKLRSEKVIFQVVQESDFLFVLEKEQPDSVAVTWVLHHMEYDEQKRYIESLYKALKPDATIVVLEDSYSETLKPESGENRYRDFMKNNKEDRQKIMGVLDWVANRVFSMRTSMPVPFAYRTLEGWRKIFEEAGFKTTKMRFLGFPDNRDINNPQSLIVLQKQF